MDELFDMETRISKKAKLGTTSQSILRERNESSMEIVTISKSWP